MVCTIAGERAWIWRAVGDAGEVMDMIVQKRRDAGVTIRLLRRLLKSQRV
jgi:putative transposase